MSVLVTKEWIKIVDAGDFATIIPENGEIKILMSTNKPTIKGYRGKSLNRNKDEDQTYTKAPNNIWAISDSDVGVTVTVNRSTDTEAD